MSYQPRIEGAKVTCPCCGGSGRVQECPDDSIPGAGTVSDICGLCGEEGLVRPAVARRYLLDMRDYDGLDALRAALDAKWQECRFLPTDSPRRRGVDRMYR